MSSAEPRSARGPALLPALAAMTMLQALVALALFAPGFVAPHAGYDVRSLSVFSTVVFGVGLAASFWGGALAERWGAFRVATACAGCVVAGMGLAALGGPVWLALAAVPVGLAFGPETPASAALLGSLVTPRTRAFVFSVRQTGNQIGAIVGALVLPAIAIAATPVWSFAAVAIAGGLAAAVFEALAPAYAGVSAPSSNLGLRGRWRLVSNDAALLSLALASVPFSAMQLTLNAYFVSFAVRDLGLSHVAAGTVLAGAQAGGLVGRLGWGVVASAIGSPRAVLVAIGLGMSVCAGLFAALGPSLGAVAQAALAILFGLTASGWNGVFVAEVSRLAPDGRIGETTGAVLTITYFGLLVAPALILLADTVAGLRGAFGLMACLVSLGVLVLSRGRA